MSLETVVVEAVALFQECRPIRTADDDQDNDQLELDDDGE